MARCLDKGWSTFISAATDMMWLPLPTRGEAYSIFLWRFFLRDAHRERTIYRVLALQLITSLVILLVVRFRPLRCYLCWQFTKLSRSRLLFPLSTNLPSDPN